MALFPKACNPLPAVSRSLASFPCIERIRSVDGFVTSLPVQRERDGAGWRKLLQLEAYGFVPSLLVRNQAMPILLDKAARERIIATPMPDIERVDEVLELLRTGYRLEGILEAVALGKGFNICINGSATGDSVSSAVALGLIGYGEIELRETKDKLILEIIAVSD